MVEYKDSENVLRGRGSAPAILDRPNLRNSMSVFNYLLERTIVYSSWQAPFASAKLELLLANNSITRARRVLDVGCGPGTNTPFFANAEYLGIDINPNYIAHARRKHRRDFIVADLGTYDQKPETGFDFILVNSFLHHVDSATTRNILRRLQSWLSPDGYIHLIELVLPRDRTIAQFMARMDRGKFPRPLEEWRDLFERSLDVEQFEPYPLGTLGLTLWNMIYCKAKAKS
jgi:SAM-dependent methyltransferase